jgi:glutamate--cysteine ligase
MIAKLQERLQGKTKEVREWLSRERDSLKKQGYLLPIYSSFDVRDAGFKAASIDANCYPSGFNNIGGVAKGKAIQAFKQYIGKLYRGKSLLLISEPSTRNAFYVSHICALKTLLTKAGFQVTVGTFWEGSDAAREVEDAGGHMLSIEKITRSGDTLRTQSFSDGFLLLNHPFLTADDPVLIGLDQPLYPSAAIGWAFRKKSDHYRLYDTLVDSFAKHIGIDPWLLKTEWDVVSGIDYRSNDSLQRIADATDALLKRITLRYKKAGITQQKPYVFIKSNSGAEGRSVYSVSSGKEVLNLNSSTRRKLRFGKYQWPVEEVVLQEGLQTIYKVACLPAEPVVYCAGGKVVGGFMRVHSKQDDKSNLNVPGMQFSGLLENSITKPLLDHVTDQSDLSVYGILAAIGNIAIVQETIAMEQQSS